MFLWRLREKSWDSKSTRLSGIVSRGWGSLNSNADSKFWFRFAITGRLGGANESWSSKNSLVVRSKSWKNFSAEDERERFMRAIF